MYSYLKKYWCFTWEIHRRLLVLDRVLITIAVAVAVSVRQSIIFWYSNNLNLEFQSRYDLDRAIVQLLEVPVLLIILRK